MHLPGCKTWHTHGAAGRKVAGKSSGTRRNPEAGDWKADYKRERKERELAEAIKQIGYTEDAIKHWNPNLLGAMAELGRYRNQLRATKAKVTRLKRELGK